MDANCKNNPWHASHFVFMYKYLYCHVWNSDTFSSQFVLQQYDNPLSKKLNDIMNEIRRQRCSYLRYKSLSLSYEPLLSVQLGCSVKSLNSLGILSSIYVSNLVLMHFLWDFQIKVVQERRVIRLVSAALPFQTDICLLIMSPMISRNGKIREMPNAILLDCDTIKPKGGKNKWTLKGKE